MMRLIATALATTLLVSAAVGQFLEKTIWLPDSFSGLRGFDHLLYNPGNNTVLATSGGYILVVDGVTDRKVAKIPAPGAGAMCYDDDDNQVYCLSSGTGQLYVVDAAANRIVATVDVAGQPRELCYNPTARKVYVANGDGLTVIDAAADTVVAHVPLAGACEYICCNPGGNKIYCGGGWTDDVYVVDCSADTVKGSVYVGEYPADLLYNPVSNKVYCTDSRDEDVSVIDADADTLIRWVLVGSGPGQLGLNHRDNKIYVQDRSSREVDIICGYGDTNMRYIESIEIEEFAYDSVNNLMWCPSRSRGLAVVDGAGDSLVGHVYVGHTSVGALYNPRHDRVYSAGSDIRLVEGASRAVVGTIRTWFSPGSLCYSPAADKLYCAGSDEGELAVVLCGPNQLLGLVDVGPSPGELLYIPDVEKVYCGRSDGRDSTLAVVDVSGDSVSTFVPARPGRHSLALRAGSGFDSKVYCVSEWDTLLRVVDAHADSLIAFVPVGRRPRALAYGSVDDRTYCANEGSWTISVIDCTADTLAATLSLTSGPLALCFVSRHNLLFCGIDETSVLVIDGRTNQILRRINTVSPSIDMAYNPITDKVHCLTCDGFVVPIDCTTLRATGLVRVSNDDAVLAVDSVANRVYCAGGDSLVTVIDGSADTVVVQVGPVRGAAEVLWYPRWRRMYTSDWGGSCISVIRDSTTVGIAQGVQRARDARVTQTVIRGVLHLAGEGIRSEYVPNSVMSLVDITGRKVMDLKPGENDIRHLAPGVYFVRSAVSGERSAVRKVIVNP